MDARSRIEAYYDALRDGDSLTPFFAHDDSLVKFGISETLVGSTAVREGLTEQTRSTTDWSVESESLRVTERADVAWFTDSVRMAWTDRSDGTRHEFDTRWSGTLERRGEPPIWRFVGMHVSAPQQL